MQFGAKGTGRTHKRFDHHGPDDICMFETALESMTNFNRISGHELGTIDQGENIVLVWENEGCELTADVATDGTVGYTMALGSNAPASQTVEQCEEGAGMNT